MKTLGKLHFQYTKVDPFLVYKSMGRRILEFSRKIYNRRRWVKRRTRLDGGRGHCRHGAAADPRRERRMAIKALDEASHLTCSKSGRATVKAALLCPGVVSLLSVAATCYYLLRLTLRRLQRYPWYRLLQKKADRTKLFELYILSIVNAAIMGSHSLRKTVTTARRTVPRAWLLCTRLLCHAIRVRNDFGCFSTT